ncbi:MAG: ComEC/Rec2 family competence protein [Ferruginibacter sp.]|nr:ComEC/Rec2 family competence protein [Ferruginibacter sp.]
MSRAYTIPVWKSAPLIRMLVPFSAGILLQWYGGIGLQQILLTLVSFSLSYALFFLFPHRVRFKWQFLQGVLLNFVLLALGCLVTWAQDGRNRVNWYGKMWRTGDRLLVRIDEPLVEKSRSYKAVASVEAIVRTDSMLPCDGHIVLYFSKDGFDQRLRYGHRLLIARQPDPIRNSGNPGAFNYQRYAAFRQLVHQVFLKKKDWILLEQTNAGNRFRHFLYSTREKILTILRTNMGSDKDELGIAEALLIGYTHDLDKDLVQAYSNTGVVHIIAISGMHLGLIYMMLIWVFSRLPLVKRYGWLQASLVLTCLWLFSLLTGGSASVIRSAVMFSFIILGKTFFARTASIAGSLAASAFVMLVYDPWYLWDVGFQLSYLAVTGIVLFQRPVYTLCYIKNKLADRIWQLAAVSIAAQVLTFPVCIYYFHQFPNLFLLGNLLAVPLSAIILYAEIALIALAWLPVTGYWLGKGVSALVGFMNTFIRWMNELPFAVWDQLPATVLTTWLLYAVVIFCSAWLMRVNKNYLVAALGFLLVFVSVQSYNKWRVANQQKLIVYNVPRYQAIDLVNGSRYRFVGDSLLLDDGWLQNFHLKPARISMQLEQRVDSLPGVFGSPHLFQFNQLRVLLVDKEFILPHHAPKIQVDVIIVSKNPALSISSLAKVYVCSRYVFDASNANWKIARWQEECARLRIHSHAVPADGAFVLDVGI